MNYISICAGIEAATVAWKPLGFVLKAYSEIEPFPSAVTAFHNPDVLNLGDMTKYREWDEDLLKEVDLVVGGTPCQSYSIAGLRKGLADERGNLTLVFIHLIDRIDDIRRKHGREPVVVVWENVPGVLNTRDNAFGCFLSGLSGEDVTAVKKWPRAGQVMGERRRVAWCVLDAQFFGVAQRRRRVFAVAVPNQSVGDSGTWPDPSEILSIGTCLRGDTPTRRKAGEDVAGDAAGGIRTGSQWTGEDCHPSLASANKGSGGIAMSNQELFSQKGAGLVKAVAHRNVSPPLTRKMQGDSGWANYNEADHILPCVERERERGDGNPLREGQREVVVQPVGGRGQDNHTAKCLTGKMNRLDSETETFVIEEKNER